MIGIDFVCEMNIEAYSRICFNYEFFLAKRMRMKTSIDVLFFFLSFIDVKNNLKF